MRAPIKAGAQATFHICSMKEMLHYFFPDKQYSPVRVGIWAARFSFARAKDADVWEKMPSAGMGA
jgi:hypothetical protein